MTEAVPFAVRIIGWVLAVCGVLGGVAAFTLAVEKFHVLADQTYRPSCSINPVLSCGSVMSTPQAEVFGFPNPLIGVAGFAVVTTLGVVVLAGAVLPRWCWLGLQAGTVFGVVFVHWLFFQSLYRIGALCPYCMVVWVAMIVLFWYVTLHNLHHAHLPLPSRLRRPVSAVVDYHTVAVMLWLFLLAGLIGQRFWDYWRTLW
ncbi:vitamin K epoxide reductase family protein [Plantactinospora sp. WMMB782]|uniref:vitamin K epoxide reductase family protein n=1 Tax=Plantactinospora sp. WMMB782 TaxID=3404121 RepID=UPI003B94CCD4